MPPQDLDKPGFRKWLNHSRRDFFNQVSAEEIKNKNLNLVINLKALFAELQASIFGKSVDQTLNWGSFKPFKDEPNFSDLYQFSELEKINWFFPQVIDETNMIFVREKGGEGQNDICENLQGLLVPGLSFSKQGQRMGRGKGYYDRFFAKTSVPLCKIGVTFEEFIFEFIPTQEHDVTMNFVVTDRQIVKMK